MFVVYRLSSGACEIRFDFHGATEDIPLAERRAFMSLGSSLDAVNAWLTTLAADTKYAFGTGYEYAKVCSYALEWLVQKPVCLQTREPVGLSLLTLKRTEGRALLAWLTLPARYPHLRAKLIKTGTLPPGYRSYALAPATRNFRVAVFSSFYDWLITEYIPDGGVPVGILLNPFRRIGHSSPSFHTVQRLDNTLQNTRRHQQAPTQPLRWQEDKAGPIALTATELQSVLEAIPQVSHGRNASNRNGALIRVLFWGMLRESEVAGAAWEAVDDETLWIYGKRRKYRAIPIADTSTWSYLSAYTNELRIPLEQRFRGPIFRQLDHEELPMTKHSIEHLLISLRTHFQQIADAATRKGDILTARATENLICKLHSHIFRTTGATFMAGAGMNLVSLSLLLGHSDPSTTLRYYLAADQLALPETVRKICAKINAALEKGGLLSLGQAAADPLQWYHRRGLLPSRNG